MYIFREAFRWICNPTASKKAPSERLPGGIDWHCHILPGVDDGFQEVKKSLEMLCFYEGAGMRDVWLTPHIMEDVPNETTHLRQVFADFQKQYQQDFAERNPADRKMLRLHGIKRGIQQGIKRGEEQTLNVVAGVVRAYHRTGSVAAAAKENNLTEEYTRTILQKLEMLPS